jgi:hypothetical protein
LALDLRIHGIATGRENSETIHNGMGIVEMDGVGRSDKITSGAGIKDGIIIVRRRDYKCAI